MSRDVDIKQERAEWDFTFEIVSNLNVCWPTRILIFHLNMRSLFYSVIAHNYVEQLMQIQSMEN